MNCLVSHLNRLCAKLVHQDTGYVGFEIAKWDTGRAKPHLLKGRHLAVCGIEKKLAVQADAKIDVAALSSWHCFVSQERSAEFEQLLPLIGVRTKEVIGTGISDAVERFAGE